VFVSIYTKALEMKRT